MARSLPAAVAGFSLLELAVVLATCSLLALTFTSLAGNVAALNQQRAAEAELERGRQALRTFLLRHHHLPCPGLDSDPYIARSDCAAGVNRGWLPYHSLDLAPPAERLALRYAVHRSRASDLVAPLPVAVDGNHLDLRGGIEQALSQLAAAGLDRQQPHHPAQHGPAQQPGCGSGAQTNPAFVLVAAQQALATDNAGQALEAPNALFFADATGNCLAAPGRRPAHDYDDRVLSEPASALLGWFLRSGRG